MINLKTERMSILKEQGKMVKIIEKILLIARRSCLMCLTQEYAKTG